MKKIIFNTDNKEKLAGTFILVLINGIGILPLFKGELTIATLIVLFLFLFFNYGAAHAIFEMGKEKGIKESLNLDDSFRPKDSLKP